MTQQTTSFGLIRQSVLFFKNHLATWRALFSLPFFFILLPLAFTITTKLLSPADHASLPTFLTVLLALGLFFTKLHYHYQWARFCVGKKVSLKPELTRNFANFVVVDLGLNFLTVFVVHFVLKAAVAMLTSQVWYLAILAATISLVLELLIQSRLGLAQLFIAADKSTLLPTTWQATKTSWQKSFASLLLLRLVVIAMLVPLAFLYFNSVGAVTSANVNLEHLFLTCLQNKGFVIMLGVLGLVFDAFKTIVLTATNKKHLIVMQ